MAKRRRRINQKFWRVLERALILAFQSRYGQIPKLNTVGKRFKEGHEFAVFARESVERIISRYA